MLITDCVDRALARIRPFLRTDLPLDFSLIPTGSSHHAWPLFIIRAQGASTPNHQPGRDEQSGVNATGDLLNGVSDLWDDAPQQTEGDETPQGFITEDIDQYRSIAERYAFSPLSDGDDTSSDHVSLESKCPD